MSPVAIRVECGDHGPMAYEYYRMLYRCAACGQVLTAEDAYRQAREARDAAAPAVTT